MSQLHNKTKNLKIAENLEVAKSFFERSKGLLGRTGLDEGHALWIHQCSSIHTLFMKFSLDVVFVDKNLKVQSVHTNVKPWRLVVPGWGANSVIEMASGQLTPALVEKGDELYVST